MVPATFERTEESDSDVLIASVLAFHTSRNLNGSSLTEEAAKKAMKKMAYKPVLANFCEIDGVRDFTGHDFEIDDEGNYIYYEKQVGCFTADKPYMKADPDDDTRKNIFAKVAIPRQYTDAAEIIERKGGTDVSIELGVNELAWDQSERLLILNDVDVLGLALLGKNAETGEKIRPGMKNAHIQLEDFSVDNNSVVSKSELINEVTTAVLKQLSNKQVDFTAEGSKTTRKEENPVIKKKVEFEETEEVKVEEAETDKVDITEEDNPAVVTEASDNEASEETAETPEVVEDVVSNFDDDPVENNSDSNDDDDDSGSNDDSGSDDSNDEDSIDNTDDGVLNNGQQGRRNLSINGKNFEVSLSEIQFSLYELVNNTYSESDNDYYSVEVYEGSKTVVMSGMFSGRSYRQGYKVRNDVYSLVGSRVPVKAVFVTADEEAELDRMRSNYSSIEEKLQKYESEPEKMEILNSSDYASIANQADFAELKKQENHFDLSVDELKEKADTMLLQYAKSGKLNFAVKGQPEMTEARRDFFAFAKVERNTSFLDGLLNSKK